MSAGRAPFEPFQRPFAFPLAFCAAFFLLFSVACGFAALCYAEFASIIPIAGSAYTYGYATLGEFVAWIIGWDLGLEYGFGAGVDLAKLARAAGGAGPGPAV